jgi:hypothetical protein
MTTDAGQPEPSTTPAVTVKLRQDAFKRVCAERGLTTITAIAATIGVSEKTIGRVVNIDDDPNFVPDDPSARFIGRTLRVWPMCSFRALFAVIDETTGEEVR